MNKSRISPTSKQTDTFSQAILQWYQKHGRQDLPWQHPKSPYYVWLSEIMLQQTQVQTVIPYFHKFIQRFPSLIDLAHGDIEDVLSLWSGLGYYARARNLHKCATIIQQTHQGIMPDKLEALTALPGIGRSTAGAILSIAHKIPTPILDGNVKRILMRQHEINSWPANPKIQTQLWDIASHYTPSHSVDIYTQAMMDLGATLCTRVKPKCASCPVQSSCKAYHHQSTAHIPKKAPKKAKPHHKRYSLVICDAQRILLERRPNKGIWGGLWCTPMINTSETLSVYLRRIFGLSPSYVQNFTPFKHVLTHMSLDITPVLIKTDTAHTNEYNSKWFKWFDIDQIENIGTPIPTQKSIAFAKSCTISQSNV